jgi:hypothetical protein
MNSYWTTHGVWLILGFLFCPRFALAYLATVTFWETNSVLCVLAWAVAILDGCSTSSSKKAGTP